MTGPATRPEEELRRVKHANPQTVSTVIYSGSRSGEKGRREAYERYGVMPIATAESEKTKDGG